MIEVYQQFLTYSMRASRRRYAPSSIVRAHPHRKWAAADACPRHRSIVGTVGGGTIELAAIDQAEEVIREGISRLFKVHLSRDLAMCCGGRMEVFIEPVGDRPWLFLFGRGHVGAALAPSPVRPASARDRRA